MPYLIFGNKNRPTIFVKTAPDLPRLTVDLNLPTLNLSRSSD